MLAKIGEGRTRNRWPHQKCAYENHNIAHILGKMENTSIQTGPAMLRILGKDTSINVRKVLWTCAALNLDYEREDGSVPPDLNPNGLVPVIVDGDGTVLWESNTICRYLANRHGDGSLLPAGPVARARVEQWMDWQAGELNNAWRYAFMALVRNSAAHADPVQIEHSIALWNRHIGILERQLDKTGAFAAGADFSLADIVLGLSVNRWRMTPIERPDYPAIAAYFARLDGYAGFAAFCANGIP
jgi:glutathione S-transferase